MRGIVDAACARIVSGRAASIDAAASRSRRRWVIGSLACACNNSLLHGAHEHPCTAVRIGVGEEIPLVQLEPELAARRKSQGGQGARAADAHARADSSVVVDRPFTLDRRAIAE